MDDENIVRTGLEKIFIAKPEVVTAETLDTMLATLQTCLNANGDMRACLHTLVPTFQEPDVVNQRVEAERKTARTDPAETEPEAQRP